MLADLISGLSLINGLILLSGKAHNKKQLNNCPLTYIFQFCGLNSALSVLRYPDSLYDASIEATGTYQLSKNLLNYKTIEIIYTSNQYHHYRQSVRMLIYGSLDYHGWNTCDLNNILHTYDGKDIIFQFPNLQSIKVVTIPANCSILAIYGWKY